MRSDNKLKPTLMDAKFCVESDLCCLVCAFLRAFALEQKTPIKVGVFRCLILAENDRAILSEGGIPIINDISISQIYETVN